MSKTQETLQEMAKLTMLSNKLNDIQLKNLKMYPFVFFDGVQEVILDYDLSNNLDVSTEEDKENLDVTHQINVEVSHMRVSYHLTIEKVIQQTHLQQRFTAIEGSVRNLLWKDITVQVFINGQKAFESNKNE